ncbi:NFACT family protein [Candidatus Woesearchaeota archaeon]|nr:NFACT family protein [Candidatus Woesearchaeota archaeon]
MKSEIAALELHYVVSELSACVGAKVEQVYQRDKRELFFSLHSSGAGKKYLRIVVGKFLYLAARKPAMPQVPPGFCLYLRKRLNNARLVGVRQLGFERIVEFSFERKSREGIASFLLYAELFTPGNIVLCDSKEMILSVLEKQKWGKRTLEPKHRYEYPKKDANVLTVNIDQFKAILAKSDKESVVKTLAIDLGLGGVYAEEVCFQSGIDKLTDSKNLKAAEVEKVFDALQDLRSAKIQPMIICGADESIVDVIPIDLAGHAKKPRKEFSSFSEALDAALSEKFEVLEEEKKISESRSRFAKVDEILADQQSRLAGLQKAESENQRKAELIYENYTVINDLLKQLLEAKKKYSWQEVRSKLKGHAMIKGVDERTGEITVELNDTHK